MKTTKTNKPAKRSAKKPTKRSLRNLGSGQWRILLLALLMIVAAMAATVLFYTQKKNQISQPDKPAGFEVSELSHDAPDSKELLRLINKARTDQQVAPVSLDNRLTKVAKDRLKDMADRQYYSHQNQIGQFYYQMFSAYGFSTTYSCENLDVENSNKPQAFMDSWLKSDKHKECLLNAKADKIGIATGLFTKAAENGPDKSSYMTVVILGDIKE